MAHFVLTGYRLSDFHGRISHSKYFHETSGERLVGSHAMLSNKAEAIQISLVDDDPDLEDAYQETGELSTLAQDVTIDGTTYPAGCSNVECEYSLTTDDTPPITFYVGRIGTGTSNSGENLLVFADHPLEPGQGFRFVSTNDGASTPYDVICFVAGTLIDTPTRPVPVEDLQPGDLVLTRDSGARPVLWSGQRRLGARTLRRAPHLAPVRIRAGALWAGMPERDLLVSPQHRIVIDDWRAEHYFGETSILAPARALCDGRNVTIEPAPEGVIYCHILLEQHELVRANGHWAETLLLGPQAARILGREQVAEFDEIFPGISASHGLPACPIIGARECAVLLG